MSSIELNHITKSYKKGQVVALYDTSFSVDQGDLFGLIGPDGAGKTSLFRILTTLLLADSGNASVEGLDVVKDYKSIRRIIGYMPGKFSLYPDLSVEENLNFFAAVFETTVEKNYELIRDIYSQIEPFKTRRAGQLSGGMKQKLALCCALIHRPKVLFLDEPTTGVDAVSRKEFWGMLKRLKSQGITILVSTAYMDEATLCDKIALIQSGKMLSINTPSEIIHAYPDPIYAVKSDNLHGLMHDIRKYRETLSCYAFGEFVHVTLANKQSPEDLKEYLSQMRHTGIELKLTTPTVEDCFIRLMKPMEDQK